MQLTVYIERNNLQVENTIPEKNVDFIHVDFCEARDSMQYSSPNANLDSGCQAVSIVTGDNRCRPIHLSVVTPDRVCWPFSWCVVVFPLSRSFLLA